MGVSLLPQAQNLKSPVHIDLHSTCTRSLTFIFPSLFFWQSTPTTSDESATLMAVSRDEPLLGPSLAHTQPHKSPVQTRASEVTKGVSF
jgi:hypothetical protein